MPVTRIHRTIRNVRRSTEIVEVLIKHGFADVVTEIGLDRLIDAGRRLINRSPGPTATLSRAQRLRTVMEELGPTFIKMGQILSCRPDLIPEEWAEEFKKLQSDCPQLPFAEIKARLESEFPGELSRMFSFIESEPIAAASMAQVHRATMHDGTKVVLKVLRPGIEDLTASDMEVLASLAEFVEHYFSNLGYSPIEVLREFARELKKEVDLTHEARATDRLRMYFAEDDRIRFPIVYWEASTKRVLALDEFKGVLLSEKRAADLPLEERKAIVAAGAESVLRQCLEFGYFHADPHPGNLFALPGGRIGFIDCGMTGQLDPKTAESLALLVTGVVNADVERVIGVVGALADVDPEKLEDRSFRADVRDFISHFENVTLAKLDMAALLQEFFNRLRDHGIKCPADLVLLIKALTTIQSVGLTLDPEFDMVAAARPHLEQLVKRRYGFRAIKRRFEDAFVNYADLAESLPSELKTLIHQFRRNRIAINLEHRGLNRLTQTIEHASRNIAFSLVIAASLVGSAILVHSDRGNGGGMYVIGVVGIVASVAMMGFYIALNRRWLKRKRNEKE